MLACFGPEGGSDDKQQQGAERETAGGNLPAVGDDVLFRHLLFEFGNLGAVFRTEVRRWGRWIIEEPACVRVWREQHQQARDEDEMFHCGCEGMGRKPALMMSADLQQGLMPLAAFVEELAA